MYQDICICGAASQTTVAQLEGGNNKLFRTLISAFLKFCYPKTASPWVCALWKLVLTPNQDFCFWRGSSQKIIASVLHIVSLDLISNVFHIPHFSFPRTNVALSLCVCVWGGVVCVCVYEVYSIPISKCVRVYTHVEMEADGRYFPCNFSETGTDPGAHQFD